MPSTIPGLEKYDQTVAERLREIATTPTGKPLVEWVRRHQPKIVLGRPFTGGGFTYPWPLRYIVVSPHFGNDWLRIALAHELVHLIKYGGPGTIFGSIEQEWEATWVAAKVWCEYPPGDPTPPAARPDYWQQAGWILDQSPQTVRHIIRKTWGGFYSTLPEFQPAPWPWTQLWYGWPQIIFVLRTLFGK